MNRVVVLDPGHGMVTPGKRSPSVPPGILEWEFNRKVCARIRQWDGLIAGVEFQQTVGDAYQMPLKNRVGFANELVDAGYDVIFVSVHANAFGNGWSDANGFVVFKSKECSDKSTLLADEILYSFDAMRLSGEYKIRNKYFQPKEAGFTVLKKTKCPAVLVECGFMTNMSDATFLASDEGVNAAAKAIFLGIEKYYRGVE